MRVVAALAAAIGLAACLESPPSDGTPDLEPDAARPVPCLEVEDEFEVPPLDEEVWEVAADPGTTYEVGAGSLTLEATPTDAWGYVAIYSRDATSLAGFAVTAEVAFRFTGNGDAALIVATPEAYIGVYADSGLIGIGRDSSDSDFEMICPDGGCENYDSVMHRFWRIREEGDLLHFETSPDDSVFTPLVEPRPVPPGNHLISVWAECGPNNEAETEVYRLYSTCSG